MTEFSQRLDAKGRDVTDLAGLWDEADLIPLAEYRRLEAEVERLRLKRHKLLGSPIRLEEGDE